MELRRPPPVHLSIALAWLLFVSGSADPPATPRRQRSPDSTGRAFQDRDLRRLALRRGCLDRLGPGPRRQFRPGHVRHSSTLKNQVTSLIFDYAN
ncbi:unnamed protein product [Linum tenue]|uniref:Uncharacterized protein n=1 Tax=Linum tenue TaxID=586396 RepID=A0AAV0PXC1_9ROSI|nr:unnamed protein product [Linum tenue]